jgi:hypothetical protein
MCDTGIDTGRYDSQGMVFLSQYRLWVSLGVPLGRKRSVPFPRKSRRPGRAGFFLSPLYLCRSIWESVPALGSGGFGQLRLSRRICRAGSKVFTGRSLSCRSELGHSTPHSRCKCRWSLTRCSETAYSRSILNRRYWNTRGVPEFSPDPRSL